jgi:FdhD protein
MATWMSVRTIRVADAAGNERDDDIAVEEPLEMQINGHSLAVVMRTPGDGDEDLELVTGFLRTEGIITGIDDIAAMHHCTTVVSPEAEDNVVQVRLREGCDFEALRHQRQLISSSSCGVCGKGSLEHALRCSGVVSDSSIVGIDDISAVASQLRAQQPLFARTGGVHAVALFRGNQLVVVREDVGRHNALDKVIGHAMRAKLSLVGCGLFLSGRVSFEMVQKAAAAGIGVVAAVSAPTSLAVDAAMALGVTVVGFVRGQQANIYSHGHRLQLRDAP